MHTLFLSNHNILSSNPGPLSSRTRHPQSLPLNISCQYSWLYSKCIQININVVWKHWIREALNIYKGTLLIKWVVFLWCLIFRKHCLKCWQLCFHICIMLMLLPRTQVSFLIIRKLLILSWQLPESLNSASWRGHMQSRSHNSSR